MTKNKMSRESEPAGFKSSPPAKNGPDPQYWLYKNKDAQSSTKEKMLFLNWHQYGTGTLLEFNRKKLRTFFLSNLQCCGSGRLMFGSGSDL